ncbi:MFS transporter [Anaerobacillus sp. MEB173]|uniref:MFS transporter n=1 Tax=Anaerobacillus sp. MEB173 TaxID=3383345 RepID=UPI003F92FBD3
MLKDEQTNQLWTKRFILLCVINFLFFMSFFMLLPTLPVYLVEFLHAKESQVGLIIGIFTIAAVISRPYTGYLMDQSSQIKIFLIGIIILLIATSGYLFVNTVLLLLLLRFVHGFGFGMATTAAGTMAAEWIPKNRRGEGIGYFGTFGMIAMCIGPIVGMFLAEQISYSFMFIICISAALIGFLLSLLLRSPNQQYVTHKNQRKFSLRRKEDISYWINTLIEKKALRLAVAMMFISIVFGGIASYIALYAVELGDAKMAGVYFSIYAISLVLTRPIAGKWFDRNGPFLIITIGTVLYFIGIIFLGLASGAFLFYLAAIVIGVGYGSLQPSYQAMIIQDAESHRLGAATATFFIMVDVGIGLGAFIFGFIIPLIGYNNMFLFSSTFLVLSYLLFYRYWSIRKATAEKEHLKNQSMQVN